MSMGSTWIGLGWDGDGRMLPEDAGQASLGSDSSWPRHNPNGDQP